MLCFSRLGLCLVVLYSGNRTKEARHGEEKGGSKNHPTLQPCNGSKARDRKGQSLGVNVYLVEE